MSRGVVNSDSLFSGNVDGHLRLLGARSFITVWPAATTCPTSTGIAVTTPA